MSRTQRFATTGPFIQNVYFFCEGVSVWMLRFSLGYGAVCIQRQVHIKNHQLWTMQQLCSSYMTLPLVIPSAAGMTSDECTSGVVNNVIPNGADH